MNWVTMNIKIDFCLIVTNSPFLDQLLCVSKEIIVLLPFRYYAKHITFNELGILIFNLSFSS